MGHAGAVLGPVPADAAADPAGAGDGPQAAQAHPEIMVSGHQPPSHVRRFIQRRYNTHHHAWVNILPNAPRGGHIIWIFCQYEFEKVVLGEEKLSETCISSVIFFHKDNLR